jgi:anti-anti-sigma factor
MRYTEKDGVYIYSIDKSMLFDEATVVEILREADALLRTRGGRHLVVDLARVKMAGTPAVSSLIRLTGRCKDLDRAFGLCGLQPSFREVLRITNLEHFFHIYEDVDQAVAGISRKRTSIA